MGGDGDGIVIGMMLNDGKRGLEFGILCTVGSDGLLSLELELVVLGLLKVWDVSPNSKFFT